MALPASGAIKFSNINVELGLTSTAQLSLGGTSVRNLYGLSTGAVRLAADGYGKANGPGGGVSTAGATYYYDFTATTDLFTGSNALITANANTITINPLTADPGIRRTVSFEGARYPYVQVRIFRTAGSSWDGKFFYTTAGHSEDAGYYMQMPEPAWDGVNYQWITIDMRSPTAGGTDWTNNTITGVRFDFGADQSTGFDVDAIVFRGTIYPIAGLAQYYRNGYFNDSTTYFSSATLQGATNTVAYNSIGATSSYEWRGYFLPPTTGLYYFSTTTDDGSWLWLGSNAASGYTTANAIVKNGGSHGATTVTSTAQSLVAGTYYPIRMQYGNNGGSGSTYLAFSGPGIASTNNGAGYYFYNGDTSGI